MTFVIIFLLALGALIGVLVTHYVIEYFLGK
jgi:hypothetical protein